MGLTIGKLLELPQREIARWQRYWNEEPWGPYRDNMHAAMIVSELLKPHLKEGANVSIKHYMLEHSDDIKRREREKFFAMIHASSKTSGRKRR